MSLAKYGMTDVARRNPTCEGVCPGAETRLFKLSVNTDEISEAVEVGGRTSYADLVARLGAMSGPKPACVCGSVVAKDRVGVDSFFADPTLRYGDIVATSDGLRVFRGGWSFPHRASDFMAFNRTIVMGQPGGTSGALSAINRMLKAPDKHQFSATIQFGPR